MSGGWRTLRRGDERDLTILRIREDLLEDGHGREHPRVICAEARGWYSDFHSSALTLPGGDAGVPAGTESLVKTREPRAHM